jgi:hypothetical protein
VTQAADFVHSLPPPSDDAALTAMQTASGVRWGSFLRSLGRIERANPCRDDLQRTPIPIEIEQGPPDRRNPTIDSKNSHLISSLRGKPLLTGRYHYTKTAKGKSVGKPRQSGFQPLKNYPRFCLRDRGDFLFRRYLGIWTEGVVPLRRSSAIR